MLDDDGDDDGDVDDDGGDGDVVDEDRVGGHVAVADIDADDGPVMRACRSLLILMMSADAGSAVAVAAVGGIAACLGGMMLR